MDEFWEFRAGEAIDDPFSSMYNDFHSCDPAEAVQFGSGGALLGGLLQAV